MEAVSGSSTIFQAPLQEDVKERKRKREEPPTDLPIAKITTHCKAEELNRLAEELLKSGNTPEIRSKALEHYEKAAQLGCVQAGLRAGELVVPRANKRQTEWGKVRIEKAKGYFRAGLAKTNGRAEFLLGSIYAKEDKGEKSLVIARNFYKKGAVQNNANAKYLLAKMYLAGEGGKTRTEAGLNLLKALNNKCSLELLSAIYMKGLYSIKQNFPLAIDFLKQAYLMGSENAAESYAGYCMNGFLGVIEKNEKAALEIYQLYAEQGKQWAVFLLGKFLLESAPLDSASIDKGIGYLKSIKGTFSYSALSFLANFHLKQKTEEGTKQAIALYHCILDSSTHQKHAKGRTKFHLAQIYFGDFGVITPNRELAMGFLKEAAEHGLNSAWVRLGNEYIKDGTTFHKSAFEAFKSAVKAGNVHAKFYLGKCYRNAIGVKKNLSKAFKWNKEAADRGFEPAAFQSGLDYLYGIEGISINLQKAKEYLTRSNSNNALYHFGIIAKRELDNLKKTMNRHILAPEDVKAKTDEMVDFFLNAYKQGNAQAPLEIGFLTLHEDISEQESLDPVSCFTQAVDEGSPIAALSLHWMYKIGKGVEQNEGFANQWLARFIGMTTKVQ